MPEGITDSKPSHNDGVNQSANQYRKSKYEETDVLPPGGLGTAKTSTAPEGMKGDNFMKFVESKGGKPMKNINKFLRGITLIVVILGMALVSVVSASTDGDQHYINTKVLGQSHEDGLAMLSTDPSVPYRAQLPQVLDEPKRDLYKIETVIFTLTTNTIEDKREEEIYTQEINSNVWPFDEGSR